MDDLSTWVTQNILNGKHRFKTKSGEDYPDWDYVELDDILNCSISKHDLKDIDNLPDKDNCKYPFYNRREIYKMVDFYDVSTPFIGLALHGSPGYTQLYPAYGSINSTGAYLTLKKEDVDIVWVYAQIQTLNFDKYIQGSTIKGIRWDDIKHHKIPIPSSTEEMVKLSSFLQCLGKYASLLEEELKLWKLLKKGMLQKMFL